MRIKFYTINGFSRAHITADAWENELGLSTDKEHVVGFLNSSPPTLAITDNFTGGPEHLQGILPSGERFNAWKVTLHDSKKDRSGRRISRSSKLEWLPNDVEISATVHPQEGDCVVLVLGTCTT